MVWRYARKSLKSTRSSNSKMQSWHLDLSINCFLTYVRWITSSSETWLVERWKGVTCFSSLPKNERATSWWTSFVQEMQVAWSVVEVVVINLCFSFCFSIKLLMTVASWHNFAFLSLDTTQCQVHRLECTIVGCTPIEQPSNNRYWLLDVYPQEILQSYISKEVQNK